MRQFVQRCKNGAHINILAWGFVGKSCTFAAELKKYEKFSDMSFNSIGFAFFFALVFAVYFLPAMARARRQNMLLLCASYFFYGVWDWRFFSLIVLTTLVSWGGALAMERWRRSARSICVAGVAVNLLVLGFFKYFNFFGENLAYLMRLLGFPFDWVVTDIMLPVGISFYTFQAIGYSIDVYRGRFSRRVAGAPLLAADPRRIGLRMAHARQGRPSLPLAGPTPAPLRGLCLALSGRSDSND